MGNGYVVNGATISCTMGSQSGCLKVTSHQVKLRGVNRANVEDVSVGSFGICKGTEKPCVPSCGKWIGGKNNVLLGGKPALHSQSKLVCTLGGVIHIGKDGQ